MYRLTLGRQTQARVGLCTHTHTRTQAHTARLAWDFRRIRLPTCKLRRRLEVDAACQYRERARPFLALVSELQTGHDGAAFVDRVLRPLRMQTGRDGSAAADRARRVCDYGQWRFWVSRAWPATAESSASAAEAWQPVAFGSTKIFSTSNVIIWHSSPQLRQLDCKQASRLRPRRSTSHTCRSHAVGGLLRRRLLAAGNGGGLGAGA